MPEKGNSPREKILACAKKHLQAGHPAAFGIRDIVEECDLSTGTFYREFPAKDDLVIAVLENAWADAMDYIDEHVSADQTAYENIGILFACISSFERQYRLSLLCSPERTQRYAQAEKDNLDLMYGCAEKLIRTQAAREDLKASLDPRKAAYLTVQMALAAGHEPNLTFEDIWTIFHLLGGNGQTGAGKETDAGGKRI